MKLDFLNRNKEIIRLKKALSSADPAFIVLYGRRRCGKSTLLQRISKKRDIYFLADQREKPLQIKSLAFEIGRILNDFDKVNYPSWEILISSLDNQAQKGTCLILDEFPYLTQKAPELPSIIQKLIDKGLKNITLIICGSSQRMMQGLVLDHTAPLYGRANEILKIRPLELGWIKTALQLDDITAIEAFSVWGGVPRYWELARDFPNQTEALKELILDRDGVLHNEPQRLLLDDMRGTGQPHSLLSLIATGSNRLSEIAARLEKPATSLTRPLSNLIDLGYIKREYPFGESSKSTKRTIYRLEDPFLLYWYRIVLPNQSLLEQNMVEEVFKSFSKVFISHVAEVWEELARRSVSQIKIGGKKWKPAQRWWGKGLDGKIMEIDVLSESLDGNCLLFGEVKWERKTNFLKVLTSLKKKSINFPKLSKQKIYFAIWSKEKGIASNKYEQLTPSKVISALK